MIGGATLLEGHVDARELLRRPGVYTTSSDQDAYGTLLGLVSAGKAHGLGETMLADGRRAVAVRISGARANVAGAITIGADFFAAAKQDYQEWREKWFREAIQNSADAGATRVDVRVVYLDEQRREVAADSQARRYVTVTVEDDGRGMDEDILLNKFLVLGGTGKRSAEGSVGGFGKAKELLLLPWIAWTIETNTIRVSGHGIQYDVAPLPSPRRGTTIEVLMAADDCTSEVAAEAFIRKCYLPNVKFVVNGKAIKAALKPGELVDSFAGKANLYYEKKVRLSEPIMLVRVNGMYMHDRWISSDVSGTIIVELTGKSTDLLNANRDSIRDYSLRSSLDGFANKLAADVKSALKKKSGLIRERFKGTGKFKAEADRGMAQAAVLDTIGSMEPSGKGAKQGLDETLIDKVLTVLDEIGGTATESDDEGPIELRAPPDALRAILQTPMLGPKHVETLARLCAWEPDFYLINEAEGFRVPARFRPEKMQPGLRKLARFWAELCRFVLVQLNYSGEYGVGWIFSTETAAAFQYEDSQQWLLLNPFQQRQRAGVETLRDEGPFAGLPFYSLSNAEDVNTLYALAVHEATHMADGITNHNESFAAALTYNFARTANRGKQIEAIRKSVVARGPAKAKTQTGPASGVPSAAALRPLVYDDQEEKVREHLKFTLEHARTEHSWQMRRAHVEPDMRHLLPLFRRGDFVESWESPDWRRSFGGESDEVLELLEPARATYVVGDSDGPTLLWNDEERKFQVRSVPEWQNSTLEWARAEAKRRGG